MRNIVAIVGRPNVGKSTLFNRLIQRRDAIVDETSGVTRDRNYGIGDWNGKEFSVIDTGGFLTDNEDIFNAEIRRQVSLAIDEADVILFLADAKDGVTPLDEDVASMLRQAKKNKDTAGKKILLVVNKVDNNSQQGDAVEFYSLGFPDYYAISAVTGSGTGDLLDEVVKDMEVVEENNKDDIPRLTVIGRPNVGKSSIINAFLGQERHIVTDIAGTTRDTIDTRYNLFGFDFYLVDTAGVRKKQKVNENIEFYSVMRSIRAIENSDVCILMIDATAGLESQDLNLFSLCERNKKGVVIVVNKWDLLEKETNTLKEYEEGIKNRLAPFSDVPVIFTSVLKKQRIFKVMEVAKEVFENRSRRISTSQLNDTLLPIFKETPPPTNKGKQIKINYITQLPTAYPSFVFFCNLPQYIKDPYKRFVENQIRKIYNFSGAPIILNFRSKN